MTNVNCGCKCSCTVLAVVASIIVGVLTAIFRISGIITVTPAFLWVALGVAVVYLALLLVSSNRIGPQGCVCRTLPVLLIGILGAILTSVLLLAIPFAATSVVGAIITGLLLLFSSLIVTSAACLVSCRAGCNYTNED